MFGRRVQTGRVKLLSCVFAIGALVVGAGACSSDDNGGEGTAVDTITVTLPTTAAPIPVDGQPCGPTSLQVTLGQTEGAMGNHYTPIVFTNIGTVSCTLDGYPDVSFVDDGGTDVGAPAATADGQGHRLRPGPRDDGLPRPRTVRRLRAGADRVRQDPASGPPHGAHDPLPVVAVHDAHAGAGADDRGDHSRRHVVGGDSRGLDIVSKSGNYVPLWTTIRS